MFRTVVNFESSRYIRDLSMMMLCKKSILFYYSAEALIFCHKYFICPLMILLKNPISCNIDASYVWQANAENIEINLHIHVLLIRYSKFGHFCLELSKL